MRNQWRTKEETSATILLMRKLTGGKRKRGWQIKPVGEEEPSKKCEPKRRTIARSSQERPRSAKQGIPFAEQSIEDNGVDGDCCENCEELNVENSSEDVGYFRSSRAKDSGTLGKNQTCQGGGNGESFSKPPSSSSSLEGQSDEDPVLQPLSIERSMPTPIPFCDPSDALECVLFAKTADCYSEITRDA